MATPRCSPAPAVLLLLAAACLLLLPPRAQAGTRAAVKRPPPPPPACVACCCKALHATRVDPDDDASDRDIEQSDLDEQCTRQCGRRGCLNAQTLVSNW